MIAAWIVAYFTKTALLGFAGKLWKGFCDFISSPVSATLAAALVAYHVGKVVEYRKVNAAWETKWHDAEVEAEKDRFRRDGEAEQDRLRRDGEMKLKMAADVDARLAVLVKRKDELEQKVRTYEDKEAKQRAVGDTAASCLTDDSDARWLHDARKANVKSLALRLRTFDR